MPTETPPSETMTSLKPADEHGSVLTGRGQATALREWIEQAVREGDDVTVDLTGVEMVSPSFADELFAKLDQAMVETRRVRFENVPPSIEPLVRYVLSGRRGALPA